jgi:cytochrome c1
MKKHLISIATFTFSFFVFFGLLAVQSQADDAAGKTIFTDSKCMMCHSMQSQGIEKKMASSKAPDLSTVGSKHNAEWMTKWLTKKETLNDKTHPMEFKGTEEDLKTLTTWLETLKEPAKTE